jgi:uncharacterized membrane protein
MGTNVEISGKGMAVIVGITCMIAPFFSPIGFWSKFGIFVLGVALVWLGVKD